MTLGDIFPIMHLGDMSPKSKIKWEVFIMNVFEIIILLVFLLALLGCAIYESIQSRKLYLRKIKAFENIAFELKDIKLILNEVKFR